MSRIRSEMSWPWPSAAKELRARSLALHLLVPGFLEPQRSRQEKNKTGKESLGQGLAKARCLKGQGLSPGLGPARSYGFVGLGQGLIIGALASRRRQKSPGLGGLKGPQGL